MSTTMSSSSAVASSSTLELPPSLRQVLRPHQIDALHFMWAKLVDHGLLRMAARSQAATIEQRLLLYQEIYGCILGHSMGLGKTLTALAFVWLLQGQIMLMSLRREQRRRAETQTNMISTSTQPTRGNALSSSSTTTASHHPPPTACHNNNNNMNTTSSSSYSDKVALCESIRVLVICPRSCVPHWAANVAEWMRPEHVGRVLLDVYLPSSVSSARGVERMLAEYYRNGGLLIVGYEEYVRLIHRARQPGKSNTNTTRRGARAGGPSSSSSSAAGSFYMRVGSLFDTIRQPLPLPQTVHVLDMLESADLVILDEAHRLRHGGSQVVQVLARHLHRVQLRIALTGTPLQNHLEAYNIMQSVVTGSDLNAQQFQRYFIAPIERGQCVDSTYQQFVEMQRSVAALRRFFAETVHHCGPEELAKTLPPRREFIFFLRLSQSQERLYRERLAQYQPLVTTATSATMMSGAVLLWHHESAHIACHPALAATTTEAVKLITASKSKESKSDSVRPETRRGRPKKQSITATAAASTTKKGDVGLLESEGMDSITSDSEGDNDDAVTKDGDVLHTSEEAERIACSVQDLTADSPKLAFTLALVQYITGTLYEKVVIFSLYRRHLTLVQALLRRQCGLQAPIFSGSSSLAERRQYIEELAQSPQCRVLLCTVRAGGVGIRLTAANHCILLDVSWNPADDTQATYRVYRYGQTKPVTIYRLAAYGTTEQVVFAYALQKSWLHRKIADLADPARQERHRTRNYFLYPCPLSLDDVRNEAIDNGEEKSIKEEEAESEEDIARRMEQFCEVECPTVAAVLRSNRSLAATLASVIPHSLLLRETTTEMIAELGKKFATCQAEAKKHIPIALNSNSSNSNEKATRMPALRAHGLLDRCEPRLVDTAHQLANHLILHTIQRHDGRRASQCETHASQSYRVDWAQDTTAIVREVDQELRRLFVHFLQPYGERGSSALKSICRSEGPLAEVMLGFYSIGVQRMMRETLSTAAYLKLRTYLASRLPLHLSSNNNTSTSNTSSGGKAREQRTTHSALEEGLLYCPYEVLQNIDAVEQTYVCTELGFDRPLVPQCIILGLQTCLTCTTKECDTSDMCAAAHRLMDYLGGGIPDESGNDDDNVDDSASDDHDSEEQERCTRSTAELVNQLQRGVLDCLSDLWPAGHGMAAPALPLTGPIATEETRMRRAYAAATRDTSNGNNSAGLLAMHEVAELLHLQHHQGQRELYTCPRCRGTFLRRSDDTTLQCLRCHYNAEFELRSDLTRQQHAVLYQLACVCNALDAFSVTRSFSTTFAPAQCTSVSQVLQRLRGAAPVVYFVEKCMRDGVQVLCDDFPPLLVHLLALQCGVGEDYDLLRRLLLANAALVWGKSLRRHVRDKLAQHFRTLMQPSRLARLTSMPMMAILLALQHAVQHEGITYAQELLPDDPATTTTASGDTMSEEQSSGALYRGSMYDKDNNDGDEGRTSSDEADRMSVLTENNRYNNSDDSSEREDEKGGLPGVSHGRTLLRFVADGLVKLLYAERLLANCTQPCVVTTDAALSTSSHDTHSSPFSSSPPSFYSNSSSRSVSPQPQQQQQHIRNATTTASDNNKRRHDHRLASPSSASSYSSSFSSSRHGRRRRRSSSRRKRSRSRSHGRRHRSHSRRRTYRRRHSSPSSSRSSSSWFSSSSSIKSRYSSGAGDSRASSSRGSTATTRTAASSRMRGEYEDSLSFAPLKTREELESEAVLAQRSAQYWIAFCEVYGSQSAERLTVYVDDAQRGLITLAAPPTHAWLTELQRTTKSGMAISEVVTTFMEKVMELSQRVRLIR